jgi:site-specific DNA recombinase
MIFLIVSGYHDPPLIVLSPAVTTTSRPLTTLQQLLSDIDAGIIDVVVVYKVDRLTRALSDFAKMVEVFDSHEVSFVSVTQQFNTTSSMGRLTLNVLLSFAQFEREVTGERIRDKIAASKKKGMWMGGFVPLGYEAVDRKLIINDTEAETVRTLYQQYIELGCVSKLKAEADRLGMRTKVRQNSKGRMSGGVRFSRGHLYRILQSPIYIGKIVHKDETHDGEHKAIVEPDLWKTVQDQLRSNCVSRRHQTTAKEPSLLADLLFADKGSRFTPSHAVKNGRRYRYYVERLLLAEGRAARPNAKRIPAHEIERVILEQFRTLLTTPDHLIEAADLSGMEAITIDHTMRKSHDLGSELDTADPSRTIEILRTLIDRIVVSDEAILIRISRPELREAFGIEAQFDNDSSAELYPISIPVSFRARGEELRIVIEGKGASAAPHQDLTLIKALVRAHTWFDRLLSGEAKSITEMSRTDNVADRYLGRVMRLAFLAPNITEAILEGRQPRHLSAQQLINMEDLPIDWEEQRDRLGFGTS